MRRGAPVLSSSRALQQSTLGGLGRTLGRELLGGRVREAADVQSTRATPMKIALATSAVR